MWDQIILVVVALPLVVQACVSLYEFVAMLALLSKCTVIDD
jgi:hypothetical protein